MNGGRDIDGGNGIETEESGVTDKRDCVGDRDVAAETCILNELSA